MTKLIQRLAPPVTAISSDASELEPKAAEAELCKMGSVLLGAYAAQAKKSAVPLALAEGR